PHARAPETATRSGGRAVTSSACGFSATACVAVNRRQRRAGALMRATAGRGGERTQETVLPLADPGKEVASTVSAGPVRDFRILPYRRSHQLQAGPRGCRRTVSRRRTRAGVLLEQQG